MTFNDNARIDTSKVQRRKGGRTAMIGGGSLVGVLILFIASQLLGVNLMPLADMPSTQTSSSEQTLDLSHCTSGAAANEDDNCRMAGAADSLDVYWNATLGDGYRIPGVILYTGSTSSACGTASTAVGPFYCPRDESIYVDTDFFQSLRSDFGATAGPLAQMYVLAHEWGHHISNLTGTLGQVGNDSGASSGSVRLELQADCYAGAWVKDASQVKDANGNTFMKPVTREEIADALNAAAAVGDDHIQQQAGQSVNPDGFTHGTSEQRQRWFQRGYESGPGACDTFSVSAASL
ncbi:neutral zinc metallopeptidase [Leucobacter sp. UT-8R-CII-1-4]|uniref:KPN_02809 family neutral zinc metallopeptidase n=1 Tax=Leucobacter sp. UT-8R-CII-1-4 TaxID=3040075 RepID=UPI0024A7C03C|nr:neutral zinc metallopeptidase [Leucobacter sp. UT-8R-CII-1-4]MDI6022432.1 neutral zinc metallopeptidase [Leucobacter sp. UT-8R-CII-1-4]